MLVPFPGDVNENPALIVWARHHLKKKAGELHLEISGKYYFLECPFKTCTQILVKAAFAIENNT